jgi:hypothetical protein
VISSCAVFCLEIRQSAQRMTTGGLEFTAIRC